MRRYSTTLHEHVVGHEHDGHKHVVEYEHVFSDTNILSNTDMSLPSIRRQ